MISILQNNHFHHRGREKAERLDGTRIAQLQTNEDNQSYHNKQYRSQGMSRPVGILISAIGGLDRPETCCFAI